ncbi:glycosyltransferase family 1 protein [Sporolactobacillus shoreae]|uniref:Glycosyltransferase family 1 protein n=1 Tax=Sporolactobacillus shoreae TaxID=1465501 RepID=A0A4Z0GSR9_9BACL|nr:glycosyltransferase family 1 protein [Sporolactobacillus shoreae]TGA99977.1 glycosyltransferase family 1 protein [Sporolactobacillus shoreae]
MKRIIVYGLGTSVGGMEEYVMNLFRHIDRSKYVFDIIPHGGKLFYAEKEVRHLGGRVYKITGQKENLLQSMKELNQCFKEWRNDHDIIYFNSCGFYNIIPFLLAKRNKYTIITHGHNTRGGKKSLLIEGLHLFNRIYVRWVSKRCFACSQAAGEWMFGKHFFKKGRVKIINNAIDCDLFRFNQDVRTDIRKQLNLDNRFVIGHVGRFVRQKNHDFMIDVFQAIRSQNGQAKLMLIGDGELKPLIEEKVKRLGLEDDVLFLGNRKDIPELMWAMDVFVLPSLFEGLPVVAVEAQAAGLSLVLSDTISREAKITQSVTFCSLKRQLAYWAKVILTENTKHADTTLAIRKKEFDIKTQAHQFEHLLSALTQSCNQV